MCLPLTPTPKPTVQRQDNSFLNTRSARQFLLKYNTWHNEWLKINTVIIIGADLTNDNNLLISNYGWMKCNQSNYSKW